MIDESDKYSFLKPKCSNFTTHSIQEEYGQQHGILCTLEHFKPQKY